MKVCPFANACACACACACVCVCVCVCLNSRRGASVSLRLAQNGHAKHNKLKNAGIMKISKLSQLNTFPQMQRGQQSSLHTLRFSV